MRNVLLTTKDIRPGDNYADHTKKFFVVVAVATHNGMTYLNLISRDADETVTFHEWRVRSEERWTIDRPTN